MKRYSLTVAALIPLLASPLIGGVPAPGWSRLNYFEQYLYFLLVIGTWNLTLFSVEFFLRKQLSSISVKTLLAVLPLLCSLVLALSSIQLFRLHFSVDVFYLLLAMLSMQSASIAFFKNQRQFAAVLSLFFTSWLLGYMTFNFLGMHFNWQALLFTAGIAGQIFSMRLIRLVNGASPTLVDYNHQKDIKMQSPKGVLRLYLLTILSGFLSVAGLALLGHLPRPYFSVYLLLPIIASIAKKAHAHGLSQSMLVERTDQLFVCLVLVVAITSLTI